MRENHSNMKSSDTEGLAIYNVPKTPHSILFLLAKDVHHTCKYFCAQITWDKYVMNILTLAEKATSRKAPIIAKAEPTTNYIYFLIVTKHTNCFNEI